MNINPYYNPIFLLRLLKSYFTDINRPWKINADQLRRYQNKSFRKIVKHSYTVPMYHKKYKEAGVHPQDISGIKDIKKLPIITKDDIRNNYPNGITPKNFDRENNFLLSTSGSSGKPVFIYYDIFSAIRFSEGYIRSLKMVGADWRKSKICLILDMKPGGIEHAAYDKSALSFLRKFISFDNIKYIHVGKPLKEIIKEVNKFEPEFLGSDPNMLREFAYHKKLGDLKNVNPKAIFSGGAMLDSYSRNYIEKTFRANILDNYGTTEGGPIALQCLKGNGYHVNSDFVFLEFLDKNEHDVNLNTPGRITVTRLYGRDTPIIRYTGLDDIVTPIDPIDCCGITTTQMIKDIGGRAMEFIRLPNGKNIAPFHVTTIPASVMNDFNSFKIKQFQIIQHKIDQIEVLVIIDEKQRNTGPAIDKILEEMKKRFSQVVGNDVDITIREVDEITKDVRSDLVKLVVSKINTKEK